MRRDHEGKPTSGRGLREKLIDCRAGWQIDQAERCGCRGSDDMCVCQNAEEPWKYGLGGSRPPTLEQELLAALKDVLASDNDWRVLTPEQRARIDGLIAKAGAANG